MGKELNKRGSVVRGVLTCSGQGRIDCPVSDNSDGTYLVSVIPQKLGQHQLSIAKSIVSIFRVVRLSSV